MAFNSPIVSSLGGLLLVRECEQHVGIISSLTNCLVDKRNQIASGYENCDDCGRLRDDEVLKMCSGRLPNGSPLASQPTASRLENERSITELYNMALAFVDNFVASYAVEPKVIVLDCDDTNFNTYGNQQLTLFNQYYGEYCYMPLLIFEGISGKMILPILRPDRGNKSINIFGLLKRLVAKLSAHWKNTRFIIRGDSHFCPHEFMDWQTEFYEESLEKAKKETDDILTWTKKQTRTDFIIGLSGNKVLLKMVEPWAIRIRQEFERTDIPIKEYRRISYKAGSWKYKQNVAVKLEIGSGGHKDLNIRFVVHSFNPGVSARKIYNDIYCKRGEQELYIKEMKRYLFADRMSCEKFRANQFRLFLSAAAYVLLLALKQNVFRGQKWRLTPWRHFENGFCYLPFTYKEQKSRIIIEFSPKHFLKEAMQYAIRRFEYLRSTA